MVRSSLEAPSYNNADLLSYRQPHLQQTPLQAYNKTASMQDIAVKPGSDLKATPRRLPSIKFYQNNAQLSNSSVTPVRPGDYSASKQPDGTIYQSPDGP